MPGSFVPTVTAITTSQDLQWMVQPTLSSASQGGPGASAMAQPAPLDTYEMPGPSYSSGAGFTPPATGSDAPGPVRQSRTRSRRARDETVSVACLCHFSNFYTFHFQEAASFLPLLCL